MELASCSTIMIYIARVSLFSIYAKPPRERLGSLNKFPGGKNPVLPLGEGMALLHMGG